MNPEALREKLTKVLKSKVNLVNFRTRLFVQWTVGLCFLFPVSEFHWEFFRPCKRSVDNDQYQPTIRFLNAIPLTCASVIV